MKRILLLKTIFALLVLPVLAQKTKSLTNADKAQIIQSILLDNRFEERLYLPDEDRLVVYLSTENISRNLVPGKIGEVKIFLKSPPEIEKGKKNWSDYCAFKKFKADGTSAFVSFHCYIRDSKATEFSLSVMEYEYRKADRKWKFISKERPDFKLSP